MINIFLNMARKDPKIIVKGSLNRFRDFIFVDDVIDAWYKLTLDKKNPNKIFNLGSGSKININQLFSVLGKVLKKKIIVKEVKGTPGDFMGCYANIQKIKKELNFKPKTSLIEGLKKFNDWLNFNNY